MSLHSELGGQGRIGDPQMSPATDPRTDPRLLAALAAVGMDGPAVSSGVARDTTSAAFADMIVASHTGFEALYEALPNELSNDDATETEHTTRAIDGPDGNEITLHIFRPAGAAEALPALVYLHGGGMVLLNTVNKVHERWCRDLAASGLVVVAVDFRSAGSGQLAPFPQGLNDCAHAVAWVAEHRSELGISDKIVLQGESGGGNLVLAVVLKAKRDDTLGNISGAYAMVPYISGGYGWTRNRKLAELPSLVETDGYFLDCADMDLFVAAYDPTDAHREDPLAWPYFATVEDLTGLPPHVISVNELDPLRDEGIAYARRLAAAGVAVVGRVNLGVVHAADSIFRQALPDLYRSTIRDIRGFVGGLPA
ncbi:alpha/beta hydrolase [Amycolatopsis pithecellobii]|uniref:Alpha/beta hydrolase fold domain-containing protein n=1 Tax=Amycolatopsis pithecellobii TaxID=664692 RepID=A0A6N7ZC73_9PSEU|nr:alpha/beta hydrolase [Amycolatopsis pithecellobii]MTD59391.1 alpha/beta hydrolase fold domain-containing protein [Amycolatopsis pithecellobii]